MRDRLRGFMAGRNGLDQLGIAALILALLLSWLGNAEGRKLVLLPAAALLAWTAWRMFSRNLEKRRAENAGFTGLLYGARDGLAGWLARARQSREYKFFRCPGCRNRLRVPRGKGRLQITCPRCGQRFSGRT